MCLLPENTIRYKGGKWNPRDNWLFVLWDSFRQLCVNLIHPRDKPGGVFAEKRQMIATQKKGCMYSAGVVMQIESSD